MAAVGWGCCLGAGPPDPAYGNPAELLEVDAPLEAKAFARLIGRQVRNLHVAQIEHMLQSFRKSASNIQPQCWKGCGAGLDQHLFAFKRFHVRFGRVVVREQNEPSSAWLASARAMTDLQLDSVSRMFTRTVA
jgi:hypothetical protein